jgi:hypothetical protein
LNRDCNECDIGQSSKTWFLFQWNPKKKYKGAYSKGGPTHCYAKTISDALSENRPRGVADLALDQQRITKSKNK